MKYFGLLARHACTIDLVVHAGHKTMGKALFFINAIKSSASCKKVVATNGEPSLVESQGVKARGRAASADARSC